MIPQNTTVAISRLITETAAAYLYGGISTSAGTPGINNYGYYATFADVYFHPSEHIPIFMLSHRLRSTQFRFASDVGGVHVRKAA